MLSLVTGWLVEGAKRCILGHASSFYIVTVVVH